MSWLYKNGNFNELDYTLAMLLPIELATAYWTVVINLIIKNQLRSLHTVCIIWNDLIPFELETTSDAVAHQFLHIKLTNSVETLQRDFYDFKARETILKQNELNYDEFVLKLTVAIEFSFCENFVVFQADIPKFTHAFQNASLFANWISLRNHFIFAYSKDLVQNGVNYFEHTLFRDQPNILVIEADSLDAHIFNFKTNRFVGPISSHPEELYLINRYYAKEYKFDTSEVELFPFKLQNLQGREIVLGAFDYRPFVAVDYEKQPQAHDRASDNPSGTVRIDGAEVRILLTYCEIYNCTVDADTTKTDWGYTYWNMTGNGFRKMLVTRHIDMTLGANYNWITPYIDHSAYIGRSGVTLMVPKPQANITWNLPLRPFQFTLWLGVSVYLLIEIVSLLLTRQMEQKIGHSAKHCQTWLESIRFGYVTTLKLFISQSSGYAVTSMSLRTLLFACYMNDIIITSIYGGGLASVLTLPILAEAPDSYERVIKFGLPWTGTSQVWIEAYSTVEKGTKDEHIVTQFHINTLDEIRNMAETDYYGFAVERMMNGHFGNTEFLTPKSLDRLKIMVDDLYAEYTVSFIPRCWAYEEHYNDFIYTWHTGGFGQIWEWKVAAEFMNQNEQGSIQASMHTNTDSGAESLDTTHFAGIMLLWVLGMALSLCVFVFEKYKRKCNPKHLKQQLKKLGNQ